MTPLEHVSYHPDYVIPLPEGHAFPMRKYEFLHAILVEEGLVGPWNEHRPGEVAWELLALAHDEGYLAKLRDGTLTSDEQRRIGMEWSPRLVRRARLAVQGTIDAAVAALHHGNGTASIFAGDPAVFTFSMHGAKNFPLKKPPSSLDVPLADGLGDEAYLATLAEHLPRAIDAAGPQFAFYLGGVDVAAGDRFGRLALTEMGIAARDRMVLDQVAGRGIPLCLTLSGGYATGGDGRTSSERTAALHAITHREAVAFLSRDSR
jgi:acetoin utilization deacetylase AcuC-like enzyme